MQQLLQNINKGQLTVTEVPAPVARRGEVLIANACSLVSAGTERAAIGLAKKSLLGKARARPDHVRRVLEKVRNEGLSSTVRQVRAKLDEPMSMGYSSAGVVIACGEGVQAFRPGDRVASNGSHAEIVSVPEHLCARIVGETGFDHAAFAVLGAIALQGVRLSRLVLGETAFVVGLGLVGQLTVALLRAAGCRVIGTDPDASKCELAKQMGCEIALPNVSGEDVEAATGGLGADAVLITASTASNGPVNLAAAAVRQKGRVVAVGAVGLELDRRPFYFKEAEFVVSCSYGPGRYDPDYEDRNRDYPAAYVRWTEQRNMQAVLDLMGNGRLDVSPLISHRFPIERAGDAYDLIESGAEPYVGILLEYPQHENNDPRRRVELRSPSRNGKLPIGVLGAGNFARTVLLPALQKCKQLEPAVICSAGGVSAQSAGKRFGFATATTDAEAVFDDERLKAVLCITPHDQHAEQVIRAIRSNKHVFVEKPLCLTEQDLFDIEETLADAVDAPPIVAVGFNRRFAPAVIQMKEFFTRVDAPLTVSVRFNAGPLPADHWSQDEETAGGRIIGEACHAIDLATFLTGSPPVRVFAEAIGGPTAPQVRDDQCFITLRHANGSISNVAYLSGGDRSFPKERVEVFGGGQIAVLDDFRSVTTCVGGRSRRHKFGGQDKGHVAQIQTFAAAISGTATPPISWEDIRAVSLASILAVRSLREGVPFDVI